MDEDYFDKLSSNTIIDNLAILYKNKYKKYKTKYKFSNFIKLLSNSPNLTIDLINKYPNECWDMKKLSLNPNLKISWIEKLKNKEWDWSENGLSSNPSLTLEIINKYQDKPWVWNKNGISANPNLQLEKERYKKTYKWIYDMSINPHCKFGYIITLIKIKDTMEFDIKDIIESTKLKFK